MWKLSQPNSKHTHSRPVLDDRRSCPGAQELAQKQPDPPAEDRHRLSWTPAGVQERLSCTTRKAHARGRSGAPAGVRPQLAHIRSWQIIADPNLSRSLDRLLGRVAGLRDKGSAGWGGGLNDMWASARCTPNTEAAALGGTSTWKPLSENLQAMRANRLGQQSG